MNEPPNLPDVSNNLPDRKGPSTNSNEDSAGLCKALLVRVCCRLYVFLMSGPEHPCKMLQPLLEILTGLRS